MPPKRTHDNVDFDDEGDEGAEVKTIWFLNSNSEKGGKVMCELCSSILKSKVSLAIHMKSIHGDDDNNNHKRKYQTFDCNKCGKTFALRYKKRHLVIGMKSIKIINLLVMNVSIKLNASTI